MDYPLVGLQTFDPAQPPSRMSSSVEEIAAGYVDLIRRMQPSGPYHLFGWSVGGILAFEVAQQLVAQGAAVAFLGILDTWAPGYARRLEAHRALLFLGVVRGRKLWHKARQLPSIVADLCQLRGRKGAFLTFLAHHHTLAHLLFSSYRADIAAELARSPQTQYDSWLRDYLDRMAAAYVPNLYPGPVHLFRAADEARPPMSDVHLGWKAITSEPLFCIEIACNHETICRPPGVGQTAAAVAAAIAMSRCSGQPAL